VQGCNERRETQALADFLGADKTWCGHRQVCRPWLKVCAKKEGGSKHAAAPSALRPRHPRAPMRPKAVRAREWFHLCFTRNRGGRFCNARYIRAIHSLPIRFTRRL